MTAVPTPPREVTQLLLAWSDGDEQARDQLMPLVYKELKRLARHYLSKERAGHTLQTTDLVHEAYLKLVDQRRVHWQNRAHFFGISAQLMRRILVDRARHHKRAKRGDGIARIPLDQILLVSRQPNVDIIALDEALARLAEIDQRKARVVELRFFGGLEVEEAAEFLRVSPVTVMRDWKNNLSQLPKLRVMARSTVFRYKGHEVDPQEVGRELNVSTVLTGRVLQLSDSLVIGAELVRVADGSQLWGQHYNRKPGDIFAVQEEIANQISEKLQMQLSGEEKRRLTKRSTQNAQAHQRYLKGRYHWNKRSEAGMKKGIQYFQEAIETDPNYAQAYAGLADSYIILGFYGVLAPDEVMPKVKAAAKKALELDDTLAEARISLAYVKAAYDRNWSGAERDYKRAIKLNANYATAHHWYGEYLAMMGRSEAAAGEVERAHELDPLSLIINVALGWIYYLGRRYDDAIERFFRTLELDPNFVHARFCLGLAYVQKSMFGEAIDEFQKVIAILGRDPGALAAMGYAYGLAGKKSEARKLLDELKEQSLRRYITPYRQALICIGLGEKDQAFEWLEKGYEERDLGLFCVKVEPMADSLRSDPRFQKLMQRLKFPAS